jgi:hypothetical protein
MFMQRWSRVVLEARRPQLLFWVAGEFHFHGQKKGLNGYLAVEASFAKWQGDRMHDKVNSRSYYVR